METKEKRSVNYAFKIVGSLRHDNLLFDRTCAACGGMYSSRKQSTCPKCSQPLTYITSNDGKPMSMSEGTLYLAFGDKQWRRDAATIAKRKNGMPATYRFKLFEFMDEHGVLTPPQFHDECRKGAKIEIVMMNHQLVPSWFKAGDGTPKVELMVPVFTNYGDTFKILTAAQYASKTVSHAVNPDGSPAPMGNEETDAKIAALQAELNALKGAMQPSTPDTNEERLDAAAAVVEDTTIDPFERANAK
jgi:hypothetical protein